MKRFKVQMNASVKLTAASPCDLIQEHVVALPDGEWRILVACSLMNMTTGLTMRPIMWKLFALWRTPHELAEADETALRELIRPLGFYNQRARRLIDMSRKYIDGNWSTPADLPGCGKYATNSWRIFHLGEDVEMQELKDKELRRYIHLRRTGEYIPHTEKRDV